MPFEGSPRDDLRPSSKGRPWSVTQGRYQDVMSECLRDFRFARHRDGHIKHLGDILEKLEGDVFGTSLGPIFVGWEILFA